MCCDELQFTNRPDVHPFAILFFRILFSSVPPSATFSLRLVYVYVCINSASPPIGPEERNPPSFSGSY